VTRSGNMRLGRCDCCRQWVPRNTLRKMTRDFEKRRGSNSLAYSRYNATGWSCTADTHDNVYGDLDGYTQVANDNTTSIKDGVVAWEDSGEIYTILGVDVSGWTRLCLSWNMGIEECNEIRSYTLAAGLCDNDATNKQELVSKTFSGNKRWFYTTLISDISGPDTSDLCFYWTFTIDSGGVWFLNSCSLEQDLSKPSGTYIETSGAAVTVAKNTASRAMAQVCRDCVEPATDLKNLNRVLSREMPDSPIPISRWER